MSDRNFILTTVGTSLFANLARHDQELQATLKQEANAPTLPAELASRIEELAARALDELFQSDVKRRRELSAELNGLYGFYGGQLPSGGHDMHWLITTDTDMGRRAGEVLKQFLQKSGHSANVYTPKSLTTGSAEDFAEGIKELLVWCEETILGYRQSGYRVIFNLTGGFKSLHGYLTITGMFYADQIMYIFETGQQLMTIPRLPLRVDEDALRQHCIKLEMMNQGHLFPTRQVADVPAGLLEEVTIEGERLAGLSNWGKLVWNRVRRDMLAKELLDFPGLEYTDTFGEDFKKASSDERVQLQQTLAKVATKIETEHDFLSKLKQDPGLQYDNYEKHRERDGTPIGHFRVSQDLRVSCTVHGRTLRLRRFGQEPAVNNKP